MKELSMHILDIAMNSVKANASLIEIEIIDSIKDDILKIIISDDGKGMSKEIMNQVTNPFYTTRKTRKVGLGLPMLKETCERCNGYLIIDSTVGKGTKVECCFERSNIDRAPLGNIGETIMTIINSLVDCELIYKHTIDRGTFSVSTIEIKEILENVDINESSVLLWIKDYIIDNINNL